MRIITLIAVVLALVSCNSNNAKNNTYVSSYEDPNYAASDSDSVVVSAEGKGEIDFDNPSFDFGKVKEGEVVEHEFTFVNSGESPVIISRVTASCGCTTPSYTNTPVLPGKSGNVKIKFDSEGQMGKQQKLITIQSNAKEPIMTIELKGTVEK